MTHKEKSEWLTALLALWTIPLLANAIFVIVGPGPNGAQLPVAVFWVWIGLTALYLLILSWRLAYLSGGKR